MFVTAKREHLQIASFDDPHLNGRRIGLQVLEENMSPPSLPLIRNGHAAQLVGFQPFGSGGCRNCACRGGRARWYSCRVGAARRGTLHRASSPCRCVLTPVSPAVDSSGVPFQFSIGDSGSQQETALRDALNAALKRVEPCKSTDGYWPLITFPVP